MTRNFSTIHEQIVSSRAQAFDLFGNQTRTWPLIYMKPPWKFSHRSAKGSTKNPVKGHEPWLLSDLARLPISQLLDKNGVLMMWTPDGRIPQAIALFETWGLRYNGITFYWVKTRGDTDMEHMHHEKDFPISTGYISRGNPTPLLMAVKGEPSMRKHLIDGVKRSRGDIRKLQFGPRMPNGQAHPKFRGLIEQIYDGPYLELFSDPDPDQSWDTWMPEDMKGQHKAA